MAYATICELDDTLHTAGIELCFAEMTERPFFATLGEAVSAYLASRSVDWIDCTP